jgi:hypothetical protein
MLCRVVLVITDVSGERIAFIIKVVRIGELGPTLAIMMEAIRSSETSVLTRATWSTIPEDDILHSQRRENLES